MVFWNGEHIEPFSLKNKEYSEKRKYLFIYKMKHEEIFTILIIYLFIQMYYNVSTVHISSHAMMFSMQGNHVFKYVSHLFIFASSLVE